MKPLGIYIHIPFCVRKCGYCDFLSMPAGPDMHGRYTEALLREINGCEGKFRFDAGEYDVRTVYIGGGTPSVTDPLHIKRIIRSLEKVFGFGQINEKGNLNGDRNGSRPEYPEKDIEVTIEVNPGTVTREKLAVYRQSGINRLSIGLQSVDDRELKALGRIHSYSDFERTYYAAREAGFENINVDIMTAIPYQTMESLEKTIDTLAGLDTPPEHISAYSLILEEGTPFYEKYAEKSGDETENENEGDRIRLPGEDEERAMYHFAVEHLAKYGYSRYEISNFARPGHESRHNTSYWTGTDYLGLGAGASSLINNVRFRNEAETEGYMCDPATTDRFSEEVRLGRSDRIAEFMFLGLRMSRGISEDEFLSRFGITVDGCFGSVLTKLIRDGLIKRNEGNISLTEDGVDYGNYVFSRFLEPATDDRSA